MAATQQEREQVAVRPHPLSGIVVADFTHVIAGPFATQILGDLGATIIKIEGVDSGDSARIMAPFVDGQSHYYLTFNRNKKSLALDLRSQSGHEVAKRLLAKADVLVENFSPGVMDRLGLGYEALAALNSRLIYASISGFGQTGTLSGKRSYDLIGQAYAGIMSVNGEPNSPPLKVGVPIGDTSSALFASIGILAALLRRQQGDQQGERLDISMNDCLTAMLGNHAGYYLATGSQAPKTGSHHYISFPNGTYAVADGFIAIAVATDGMWQKFCSAFNLTDLANDPRNATILQRSDRRSALDASIKAALGDVPMSLALQRLDAAEIPCGPVNDIASALKLPSVREREMILHMEHPSYGKVSAVGSPLGKSLTVQYPTAPPLQGEDTLEILQLLGFSENECAELNAAGVIRTT